MKERVKKTNRKWLVTVGICTHLGCVQLVALVILKAGFVLVKVSQYDTSNGELEKVRLKPN